MSDGLPVLADRGVFLVDGNALRLTQVVEREVLELDPEILGDETATRRGWRYLPSWPYDGQARSLNSGVEGTTELVHNESREGFAFDVLEDDRREACQSPQPSPARGGCP